MTQDRQEAILSREQRIGYLIASAVLYFPITTVHHLTAWEATGIFLFAGGVGGLVFAVLAGWTIALQVKRRVVAHV